MAVAELDSLAQYPELHWLEIEARSERVVPGQPIELAWTLRSLVRPYNLGLLTPRLWLGDRLLRQGEPVHVYRADSTAEPSGRLSFIAVDNLPLQAFVYGAGLKRLRIELGTPDGSVKVHGETQIWVDLDTPGTNQWEWSGKVAFKKSWKEGYALGGNFHNHSQYAGATFAGQLLERSEDSAERGDPRDDFGHIRLAPGALSPGTCTIPGQDWRWLEPGTWRHIGPPQKVFDYTVHVTAQDDFDNVGEGDSGSTVVTVRVPGGKLRLAAVAFAGDAIAVTGAVGAGASLAGIVTAIAAPVLLVVAGAGVSAAAAAGNFALDPPPPDPAYREKVVPVTLGLADRMSQFDEAELRAFWGLSDEMLALLEALIVIDGRVQAAAFFDDKRALKRLATTKDQIYDNLATAGTNLEAAALDAGLMIDERLAWSEDAFQTLALRWDEWSDGVRNMWLESFEDVEDFDRIISVHLAAVQTNTAGYRPSVLMRAFAEGLVQASSKELASETTEATLLRVSEAFHSEELP